MCNTTMLCRLSSGCSCSDNTICHTVVVPGRSLLLLATARLVMLMRGGWGGGGGGVGGGAVRLRSRGDLEPSLALLVGDLLLRCVAKLLLPGVRASRMRAAAMPLARLCPARPTLLAVSERGEAMRGLGGARPSTSRVSITG